MTLEIQTQDNLGAKKKVKDPGEGSVNVVPLELATSVGMAQEETDNRKCGAEDLGWNVPW